MAFVRQTIQRNCWLRLPKINSLQENLRPRLPASVSRKQEGSFMSLEEENKAVVIRYVEAFNRGDLQTLRLLLSDDAEIQGVMGRGLFDRVEPIWRQLIEGYACSFESKNSSEKDALLLLAIRRLARLPSQRLAMSLRANLRASGNGVLRDTGGKNQASLGCTRLRFTVAPARCLAGVMT